MKYSLNDKLLNMGGDSEMAALSHWQIITLANSVIIAPVRQTL